MFTYELRRDEDATGVSGVGVVAQGVVFDDCSVAQRWVKEGTETMIYASLWDVVREHCDDGAALIVPLGDVEAVRLARSPRGDTLMAVMDHTAHDGHSVTFRVGASVRYASFGHDRARADEAVSAWLCEMDASGVLTFDTDAMWTWGRDAG